MAEEHPDLTALLRGRLDNATATATGEHLARCEECRTALVEAAVGHAVLVRTVDALAAPVARPQPQDGPLPPLAPLPRRGGRVVLLTLVAAAVVVAGLLVGLRPWQNDEPAAPVAAAERSAPLEPLAGSGSGVVSMTDGGVETRMVIETHDLPTLEDGQFYYAWLLDPATNKMLPLGQVGTSAPASFDVAADLLAAYSAVDVSLEVDDGDPQHSPTSVLRASYA